MSMKNPVTSPGIDPGTVRLVAQRLNHYTTPGPNNYRHLLKSLPFMQHLGSSPHAPLPVTGAVKTIAPHFFNTYIK